MIKCVHLTITSGDDVYLLEIVPKRWLSSEADRAASTGVLPSPRSFSWAIGYVGIWIRWAISLLPDCRLASRRWTIETMVGPRSLRQPPRCIPRSATRPSFGHIEQAGLPRRIACASARPDDCQDQRIRGGSAALPRKPHRVPGWSAHGRTAGGVTATRRFVAILTADVG